MNFQNYYLVKEVSLGIFLTIVNLHGLAQVTLLAFCEFEADPIRVFY